MKNIQVIDGAAKRSALAFPPKPKSHWLHRIAVGGILVACLGFASFALRAQNKVQQKPPTPPAAQAEPKPASQPLPVTITGPVRLEREQTVEPDWNKLKCGDAKSHDEADLCEQRKMAKSAEETVQLNWIQIGLGIGGFVALIFTLHLNRRATNAAVAATAAVERNMFEVEAPILYPDKIAETIRDECQGILMRDHPSSPHRPVSPTIFFEIKNFGDGAATAVFQSVRAAAVVFPHLTGVRLSDPGLALFSAQPIVEPKQSIAHSPGTAFQVRVWPAMDAETVRNVFGGQAVIVFHGEIRFSAMHGARYVQRFASRFDTDGRRFIALGPEHNNRTREEADFKPPKRWWQFWKLGNTVRRH